MAGISFAGGATRFPSGPESGDESPHSKWRSVELPSGLIEHDHHDVGGRKAALAQAAGVFHLGLRSDVSGDGNHPHAALAEPGVDFLFQAGDVAFDALEDLDLLHGSLLVLL